MFSGPPPSTIAPAAFCIHLDQSSNPAFIRSGGPFICSIAGMDDSYRTRNRLIFSSRKACRIATFAFRLKMTDRTFKGYVHAMNVQVLVLRDCTTFVPVGYADLLRKSIALASMLPLTRRPPEVEVSLI